ncbi:NACHT domain-containing protein [Kitasatospora phosalacinea]|uniref:NACHT domain-containing protein n=1 Tax=Kitasatospora phosalacinea TaxID=2065 RepID=UPI0035D5DCF4
MAETYPYEQLDGRRFQRLAQSLIVAEEPRAQCFPISGPDGGRDASILSPGPDGNKFVDAIIYQVKFREPTLNGTPSAEDLFNWVTANLRREIPKLRELARRGAREFVYITNVSASGHLDGGLRDRIQVWAGEYCPLPSRFWWRDDLDARLDNNLDLVFRHSLFNGPASVKRYFEQTQAQSSDSGPIRESIRSKAITELLMYLDDQYEADSKLRFKQADLDSTPILDFFIDVPLVPQISEGGRKLAKLYFDVTRRVNSQKAESDERTLWHDPDKETGAAAFFLNIPTQEVGQKIVLEGAPGQGKSTLTQYIGQVYRAIILSKKKDLGKIPQWHKGGDLRLPIRVELRRLASWLQGRSPWDPKERVEPGNGRTLQAFLVSHIRHVTDGSFAVEDLLSILQATPSILMLDGLDEVADSSLRDEVVKCCDTFVSRISSLGSDIRVVATSRPAAFSKSAAFPRGDYYYFSLGDLNRDLIDAYTESWIKLRRVPKDQAAELRQVLSGSLSQSHVADLARNPMQLAILIWLVYVKGWSLPDKRTALYEAYMSTFLDREADKSPAVRRHRDILMELHGFLGWMLHARSEIGQAQDAAGDVAETELKKLLGIYLSAEERPTSLVDQLFHGVERVFVLVSRVEGRFEFEVQPLREFFAARYLYKTSPHSTSAFPVNGTRPDRLEALIRNPYWLNVARFFCGWYDKGELADLSRRLQDLCEDDEYKYLSHPRQLVSKLLADYVTTASRRDTRQLAELLADPLGFLLISNDAEIFQKLSNGQTILPPDAGLPILVEAAKAKLILPIADEQIKSAGRMVATQLPPEDRSKWWISNKENFGSDVAEWLRRGSYAGALDRINHEDLLSAIGEDQGNPEVWIRLVDAGRLDFALQDQFRISRYMTALGSGSASNQMIRERAKAGRFSGMLVNAMRPESIEGLYYHYSDPSHFEIDQREFPDTSDELASLSTLFMNLTGHGRAFSERSRLESAAEAIRQALGDCWAAWRVAIAAGPVASRHAEGALFGDAETSLTSRAAMAWSERQNVEFWASCLDARLDSDEMTAVLACMAQWAPSSVIAEMSEKIFSAWSRLDALEVAAVHFSCQAKIRTKSDLRISIEELDQSWQALPGSFSAMLQNRVRSNDIWNLIDGVRSGRVIASHESLVAGFIVGGCLKWMTLRTNWGGPLDLILQNYRRAAFEPIRSWSVNSAQLARHSSRFSKINANKILDAYESYPLSLVMAAEAVLSARVTFQLPTMRMVADQQLWFEEGVG